MPALSKIGQSGVMVDEMDHTLAKNTSRRPSSLKARSHAEEIAVSSAASACKVVTLKTSVRVSRPGYTNAHLDIRVFLSNGFLEFREIIGDKIQKIEVRCT